MISAHLFIFGRVDGCSISELKLPLSVFDETFLFQYGELPADERVIVRVQLSGDERTAVIDMSSKTLYVFSAYRWEVFHPIVCICKIRDCLLGNA
jgi:hypothetical protein